jgi:hypothetical protein
MKEYRSYSTAAILHWKSANIGQIVENDDPRYNGGTPRTFKVGFPA